MEELNNKLSSGNPVVVAQIVSKLVQIIKTKDESDVLEVPEFKFLREKCISNDSAINVIAAEGILNVVRHGSGSLVKSVITEFVTIITTMKCSTNVTFVINNLLLIDLQKELSSNNSYKSTFNLRLPQHPFIIMLSEEPTSWFSIFKEIMLSYKTVEKSLISHYDELYKPVFLYTLCNPQAHHLLTFKQKLWSFVLHKEAAFNSNAFIECLLAWMQFENRDTIQINCDFLIELSDLNNYKRIFDGDLLLLWQIAALDQIISHNFDPRTLIFSINNGLEHVNNTIILNPILLTLSKCISSCSSIHLLQLLKLCKAVVLNAECDTITKNVLKSSLLLWITNPSDLISDAISYASNLFALLKTQKSTTRLTGFLEFEETFQQMLSTNTEIYLSTHIYILLESWRNEQDIKTWLEKLDGVPIFFTLKMFNFLIGLFVTEFEEVTIAIKVFELILKCVDHDRILAPNVLTVLLFKLTSVTDSKLHYQLLKALPKVAVTKNNFQKVVTAIQALNKGPGTLKTFSTTLMLDLWKIDNKCYPYLENFLIAPHSGQGERWEFFVTKAHVLKELCAMKPELYGKEIVAHLSKILNECNNADGAVASALAIDGITLLCKSEIIDAVTTWDTLAPMFKNETRTPVIKSICSLISEVPSLSYSDAYPKLIEDVVAKLWEYLVLDPSDEVWTSALNALTHFSVEQIVAKTPDQFFDEEILNIRETGHVVPGSCWIHFLKSCSESKLTVVGDFLIKLASLEVSNYLKFVYQVKGNREPVDYSYLPMNSVVRGISTYIKSRLLKWKSSIHKEVYLQCLRIFGEEYSKPLPPLDWCFLQELFHEPEAKDFCVNIAAHQVVLSGTARRFIVNYIEAVTQDCTNERDVLLIYRNFKHLANSVQPLTLKPFLEATILHAVALFKNGSEDLLIKILGYVKETLKNEDIQEANKIVVAQIISDIFDDVDMSSELFKVLLDCIVLFPMKCIDDMSSPKAIKEVRLDWFKKAITIRCSLAVSSSNAPLNLLNELMEVGSSFPSVTPFLFEQFAAVFEKHKNNTECVLWSLELIGQIQAVTAEKSEQKEIILLCNVFILATIVFSGHSVFLKNLSNCDEMYKLFPRAIATLLDVNHWSICTTQALEWFHHMTTEEMFAPPFRNMFLRCLRSLRHETEFYKNMKWTKYLNLEC